MRVGSSPRPLGRAISKIDGPYTAARSAIEDSGPRFESGSFGGAVPSLLSKVRMYGRCSRSRGKIGQLPGPGGCLLGKRSVHAKFVDKLGNVYSCESIVESLLL